MLHFSLLKPTMFFFFFFFLSEWSWFMRLSKITAFRFHLHFRQRPNLFKPAICLVFNIINWPPAAISVHLNQSLSYKQ